MTKIPFEDLSKEDQIRVRWHLGDLRFKLHSGQQEIYADLDRSKEKLFVINCSRQWGKTYLMVTKAIEIALRKPDQRIYYVTKFMKDLVKFVSPTFKIVLNDCPNEIQPLKRGDTWIFQNGSEITMCGLEKHPDGPRGNTLDYIIMDEVRNITNLEYLYTNVMRPTTTHRPNAKIIMISTPPESPAHDFCEFITEAKIKDCYAEFTIYDNPLLSKEAIQDIVDGFAEGEDSTAFQREYMCRCVTEASKQVVPEWVQVRQDCIKPRLIDQHYHYYTKYISMDIGVKDFTAGLFGYYDFTQSTLFIEDEFILHDKDVTDENIAKLIKQKKKELWNNQSYRGIVDIEKLLVNNLASAYQEYFTCVSKSKKINMVQRVRAMVKNKQIVVDPKCKYLIGCLDKAIWDSGSLATKEYTGFARVKELGHFDHLDALIYMVISLDRHNNPIPPDWNFDPVKEVYVGERPTPINQNVREIVETLMPPRKGKW